LHRIFSQLLTLYFFSESPQNEAPAFEDPQAAGALGAQAANPAEAGTAAVSSFMLSQV
jgi:hypothetical protein